uniref:Uncharacterized protein n=1 Tax=Xiphophorus maculatus TaxID=8083 RepID=A0A3B5QH55_XIPMA
RENTPNFSIDLLHELLLPFPGQKQPRSIRARRRGLALPINLMYLLLNVLMTEKQLTLTEKPE